jgi:hypothetical protein
VIGRTTLGTGIVLALAMAAHVSTSIAPKVSQTWMAGGMAGTLSAEPIAPEHPPAKPSDEGSAPASYAVILGEVWVPPVEGQPPFESPVIEPIERFVEPPEPPPRV